MRNLYVQNFGPITEAEIDIRQFNLYIGEQSIGKSILAKLITIFTDYINLFLFSAIGETAWKKTLESFDLQVYASNPYSIRYQQRIGDNVEFFIEVKGGAITSRVMENDKLITSDEEQFYAIVKNRPFYHDENLAKLLDLSANDENMPVWFEYIRNSLYIPAERIIGAQLSKLLPIISMGKEQLPMNVLRYLTELNNAKIKYSDSRLDLLNVLYLKKDEEDWIVLDNAKEMQLKYASSGIQSTLPLLLVLRYGANNKEYASFVVEEPECNLFPLKQKELLQFLIQQVYSQERMLTITTHSPYLLSTLNNYLYAGGLSKRITEESKVIMKEIIPSDLWIDPNECSVYSLGEKINGGTYCKNLIDKETGLVDFNYLDGVSIDTSEEFGQLKNLYIKELRIQRKK